MNKVQVFCIFEGSKPSKHHAKWKKPVTKEHMLNNSIYMKYTE
jgi:hypothetical protein